MTLPETLGILYDHLRRGLREAGIDSADIDSRLLIHRHVGCDWADIIANPDRAVEKRNFPALEADWRRRLAREPLSRIFGVREFRGLEFQIGPDTLDPRPDTETLVALALARIKEVKSPRILDLGTGSGCILIAVLHERADAFGIGVDLAEGAIRLARTNAQSNGVVQRSAFFCGSWADAISGDFDLILSNPPYIPGGDIESLEPEVRNHDPILALAGGKDGLDCYRKIIIETKRLLKSDGTALFEIGINQEHDIARLVEDSGLCMRGVHPDLAGMPRVLETGYGDK